MSGGDQNLQRYLNELKSCIDSQSVGALCEESYNKLHEWANSQAVKQAPKNEFFNDVQNALRAYAALKAKPGK